MTHVTFCMVQAGTRQETPEALGTPPPQAGNVLSMLFLGVVPGQQRIVHAFGCLDIKCPIRSTRRTGAGAGWLATVQQANFVQLDQFGVPGPSVLCCGAENPRS